MTTALVPALLIGIAFGWALERGGMGNARKLAGQFYLRDLAVFKIMFSAVVTAMLGSFWLARLGWIDLNAVALPETAPLAQAVGGALFGVGFVVSGLCPGTSCVAAVSGHLDGLAAVLGMLGGVVLFAELWGGLEPLYGVGSVITIPEALGVPYGVVVGALTLVALAGFAGAEWIERRNRA
jgi:uncharacterized membrane protein YedE/YeeE